MASSMPPTNRASAEVALFLSDRFFKFLSRCQVHARLLLDLGPGTSLSHLSSFPCRKGHLPLLSISKRGIFSANVKKFDWGALVYNL